LKIETLLPLIRESRDQDLQSVISCHGSSSKRRCGGGHFRILAQHWVRSIAVQWLSPMLICPIKCPYRSPQIARNRGSHSGFESASRRRSAVERRLAPAGAGYNRRALGTPMGVCASTHIAYMASEIFVKI